jgi:hypothetical protein
MEIGGGSAGATVEDEGKGTVRRIGVIGKVGDVKHIGDGFVAIEEGLPCCQSGVGKGAIG